MSDRLRQSLIGSSDACSLPEQLKGDEPPTPSPTEGDQQIQTLLAMVRSLNSSASFEAALGIALTQICALTGWRWGEAWLPTDSESRLVCSAASDTCDAKLLCTWRTLSRSLSFTKGVGLPGQVWQTQQWAWHADLFLGAKTLDTQPLDAHREAIAALSCQAAIGIPVFTQNRVLVVLVFFSTHVQEGDRNWATQISTIAPQLGVLLHLKQTEATLRQYQLHLAAVGLFFPGVLFTRRPDPNWTITYLSKECEPLTGYRPAELTPENRIISFDQVIHPDDRERVIQVINAMIAQQQPYNVEYRIRTRSGRETWVSESGAGIFDEQGTIVGLQGVIADITERVQAEAALRDSEAQFRAIFKSAAIAIGLTNLAGELLDNNPAAQNLFGYTLDEMREMHFSEYTHPADLESDLDCYQELLSGKRDYYQIEKRYIRKGGEFFWGRLTVSAIRDATGQAKLTFGMVEDISERKQFEAALRDSELRFRVIFENAAIGVAVTNFDGTLAENNRALQQMLGYSEEELQSRSFVSWTHPDDIEADLSLFRELVQGSIDYYQLEKRYIRKDGELFWGRLTISAIRGAVPFALGIIEDISERKQAEEALRHSEARNRALLNAIPELLFLLAEDGTYLYVQAEQGSDLILPPVELVGETIQNVLPADVAQQIGAAIALVKQTGQIQTIEYQLTLDQEKRYFEARVAPCGAAFLLTARNITERKQTERSLQDKEAFLRLILDNIPQHIFWKDQDLIYRGANRVFATLVGIDDPETIVGKTDHDLWAEPQATDYRNRDLQVLATGTAQLHVIRNRTQPDGSVIWQDLSKVPIHDAQGNVIGVLGTFEDITDRRLAEEALQRREQYLAALVEVQRQLLVSTNETKYDGILAVLGKASTASRVYVFENHLDPSGGLLASQRAEWCAEGIAPQIDNPLLQNVPYDVFVPRWVDLLQRDEIVTGIVSQLPKSERELLAAQGILSVLVLPLTISGQFVGFIGFDNCVEARIWEPLEIDLLRAAATAIALVKERQQAETALRESEFRYRFLADSSTDLISRHTDDGTFLYASPASYKLLGYHPNELVGRSAYEFFHPNDLAQIKRSHQEALNSPNQEITPFSYRICRQDGCYVWFETSGKAVADPKTRSVREMIAISRDITARKQAENLLASQKQVLELIATDSPLTETLDFLIRSLEDQSHGMLGSVLLLATDGLHLRHGAAPSLPEGYVQAIDGISIGLETGSCGAAAYLQKPVIVTDIAIDPLWKEFRNIALSFGLRACWSMPILSSQGKVLGTFAMHHRKSCSPTSYDWQLIETVAQLARVAIERHGAEAALREAEARYRSIFENAVEGIFQTTADGRYLIVNPMLAEIYGYESPEELVESLTDIEHQLYVNSDRRREFVQLLQTEGAVRSFESQVYRRDGSIIWISENARTICDAEGEVVGYEGTVRDITERKQAEADLTRRDVLLQGVADATHHLLTHPNYEEAIALVLKTIGIAAQVDRVYIFESHPHPDTGEASHSIRFEWIQEGVISLFNQPYCQNQAYSEFGLSRWYTALSSGQSIHGIVRHLPPAERQLLAQDDVLSLLIVPIFVADRFWGFVGLEDCHSEREWLKSEESILVAIAASIGAVLKRHQTEEIMRYQAYHDLLTGLPNRILFSDRLQAALTEAEASQKMLAVMFLDLDRFKTINDTLGHTIGDQLLQLVSQRLTRCLREEDTIARWGGDEFTLLLPQIHHPHEVEAIARRILQAFKSAFHAEGQELYISCSIGIALYPHNGIDTQTLLKNADAALYRAKEQGRNHHQFYNAAINPQASQLLTLENSLHHALERQEFVLYYQPQVSVETGAIVQMEALIRWQHPQLGLVPPQTFITLAEENGLILPIGEWVLRTACAQCRAWQIAGLPPVKVAVNLSARQFQQPNLVQQIADILDETGLEPNFLELEVTETAAMRDVDFSTALLHDLREMGVRIAMDDFGTGYSSLSYLKKFPLHALKIDRSFIQDLTDNPDDIAIISAIITLGRGLHLNVVAEGVETQEQADQLRSFHCTEMQGFWFSRPLPPEAATQFLKNSPSGK